MEEEKRVDKRTEVGKEIRMEIRWPKKRKKQYTGKKHKNIVREKSYIDENEKKQKDLRDWKSCVQRDKQLSWSNDRQPHRTTDTQTNWKKQKVAQTNINRKMYKTE